MSMQRVLSDAYDPTNGQLSVTTVTATAHTIATWADVDEIFRAVRHTDGTIRVISVA